MRPDSRVLRAAGLIAVLPVGAGGRDHSATESTHAAPSSSATTSAAASAPTTSNPYGVPSTDPPAPNEPVLTVTGGTTPLSLTLDQLSALGINTVTIDEPFVKKRQTFGGVPLSAVLAKAGIPETATIDTVALNAYHYASAARPMIDSNAIIATKRDNAPIPYDQGGPIRIVFPDGTQFSSVLDAWNWSLATIDVTSAGSGSP
jgi:hypothetical protein